MANKGKEITGAVSQDELDKLLNGDSKTTQNKKKSSKSATPKNKDEMLTQEELDKILNDLSASSVEKGNCYDFKRPMKYSKELMNTLALQAENLSRIVTTTFSMKRKMYTHTSINTVEQLTLEELLRSIPIPSFIYEVKTSIGQIVIAFGHEVARALIKQHTSLATNPYIDELDLKYFQEGYVSDFLKNYASILSENSEIEIIDIKHTNNPQKVCGNYSEMAILTTLDTQIGEKTTGAILLFHSAEVVKNLSKSYFSDTESKIQYVKAIGDITLPDNTFAEIARCNAIPKEDLQIGKIIVLPKKEEELLEIVYQNKVIWKGKAIYEDENFGIKLTTHLEKPINYTQNEYLAVRLGAKHITEDKFNSLTNDDSIILNSKTSQLSEIILNDETVALGEIKIVDGNFAIQIMKIL